MAAKFLILKYNVRLIYPLYQSLQIFRSKQKGKIREESMLTSPNKFAISDSMENYISELGKRKANKFNKLRSESLSKQSEDEISRVEEHSELIEEINRCLDDERDCERIENLIDKWINARRQRCSTLPHSVVCELLELSSRESRHAMFHKLVNLIDKEFYQKNQNYFELLALELEFRAGRRNIDQILDDFELLFKQSIGDDSQMKQITKFASVIIKECVEKKGESFVIKLRDKLVLMCREGNDYRLLFDLWRNLFER